MERAREVSTRSYTRAPHRSGCIGFEPKPNRYRQHNPVIQFGIGSVGFTIGVALLLAAFAALAHAEPAANTNLDLIPESKSLWTESLLWDKDIVVRAGVGYKDNVLLSPSSPQASPFFTCGFDLTVFRLPLDGWEVNFLIIGDDIRYFRSPGGLNSEDLFISSAQVQKYIGLQWRAGLELRYSYVDQVLNELLISGGVRAVEAQGNTLGLRPFIRRDLSTNWWVQLEAPLAREWWRSPLDSTWKFGGQAILGLSYGPHSQITLTGGALYIPHDEWLARDALGTELPGRKLDLWREVAELRWQQQWDAKDHWSTTTKLGFNHSHDNGGGFFDYTRYFATEEARFHTKDWEAKVSVGLSYYDFPVQTIDTPPAPKLHLTTFDAILRVERRLYKSIRCFAAFEYEQTASNDSLSEYRARVGAGGFSWEF